MKQPKFGAKKKKSTEMVLQITSMADVFTIILVFLLKSYATSSINITPTPGMKLPAAAVMEDQVEALKVEISSSAVQVDDSVAATLKNFRFAPTDLQNGISSGVDEALKTRKKRQVLISKSNSDVKADSKILIVADQRVPYVTLKSVLTSAAVQGYTDFKLVVVKKQ